MRKSWKVALKYILSFMIHRYYRGKVEIGFSYSRMIIKRRMKIMILTIKINIIKKIVIKIRIINENRFPNIY